MKKLKLFLIWIGKSKQKVVLFHLSVNNIKARNVNNTVKIVIMKCSSQIHHFIRNNMENQKKYAINAKLKMNTEKSYVRTKHAVGNFSGLQYFKTQSSKILVRIMRNSRVKIVRTLF